MKDGPMRNKLHRLFVSALLAGSVAVLLAPAAEANRGNGGGGDGGGYVPAPNPGTPPQNIPVNLPQVPNVTEVGDTGAIADPGSGSPDQGGVSVDDPAAQSGVDSDVLGNQDTRPDPEPAAEETGVFGGILSRTGAETLPLARAGLAALTLGTGLVLLARRRRVDAASA